MIRRRALPLLVAASACATVPPAGVPLTGAWGGPHVGLQLGSDGGTLDYDCAAGRIDGPVIPRPDGSFEALGTHIPGSGGPDRSDVVPQSFAARYNGSVRGGRMTLQVRVQYGVLVGPFTLRRGAEPMIFRCL